MKKALSFSDISLLRGASALQIVVVLLSATTLHTFGLAVSVSPSAILFVDHITYASTSLQIIGTILVAASASRLANEFIGAEFPY